MVEATGVLEILVNIWETNMLSEPEDHNLNTIFNLQVP
jgi:hypothetical protein